MLEWARVVCCGCGRAWLLCGVPPFVSARTESRVKVSAVVDPALLRKLRDVSSNVVADLLVSPRGCMYPMHVPYVP